MKSKLLILIFIHSFKSFPSIFYRYSFCSWFYSLILLLILLSHSFRDSHLILSETLPSHSFRDSHFILLTHNYLDHLSCSLFFFVSFGWLNKTLNKLKIFPIFFLCSSSSSSFLSECKWLDKMSCIIYYFCNVFYQSFCLQVILIVSFWLVLMLYSLSKFRCLLKEINSTPQWMKRTI